MKKKITISPSNLLLILWVGFGLIMSNITYLRQQEYIKKIKKNSIYYKAENVLLQRKCDSIYNENIKIQRQMDSTLSHINKIENKKQIIKIKYETIYKNLDTIHAFGLINEFKNVFSRNGFK